MLLVLNKLRKMQQLLENYLSRQTLVLFDDQKYIFVLFLH